MFPPVRAWNAKAFQLATKVWLSLQPQPLAGHQCLYRPYSKYPQLYDELCGQAWLIDISLLIISCMVSIGGLCADQGQTGIRNNSSRL